MDITEKINLISRPPIEEVVTEEELLELLKNKFKSKALHWNRNFWLFTSWKFD